MSVTRAEVCAVACAELFRDAGEIMVSPMTTIVQIGARLARLTFSPRYRADRRGGGPHHRRHPGHRCAGGDRGLDALRPGLRDPGLGGPAACGDGRQPDRPVRQPEPVCVRTGAAPDPPDVRGGAGAPGNTINHATSYFVGNHSKRVFTDTVDIVSGIGWDKIDPDNPAYRFANIFRVVSNLGGVFDFNGPDHQFRAVSLHPRRRRTTRGRQYVLRGARAGRCPQPHVCRTPTSSACCAR